ncbi:MAG: hypothetical protein VX938_11585, partial [Myxococcota bacterium]|nr:hypothetical protein [Myxococcota bacterium]
LGEDDLGTIEQVRRARVPSLAGTRDGLKPELDRIIARALAREPRARYATTREFGAALTTYLFDHHLQVSSYDVAAMLSYLFDQSGDQPPWKERLIQLIDEEIADAQGADGVVDPSVPLEPALLEDANGSSGELSALWERLERLPEEISGTLSDPGQSTRPSTRSLIAQLEGEQGQWSSDAPDHSGRPFALWILLAIAILMVGIGLGFWL